MKDLASRKSYKDLLAEIKSKIQQARVKAAVAANQELLILYWDIGNMILKRQAKEGWGAKVADQLSSDLKKSFPDMKGFSRRNIHYMRQFSETYPDFEIVQVPLAQISWYHNVTLLHKCKDEKERFWYARKTIENGWLRNIMVHQIETDLYNRQGKAITNFDD